MGIAIPMLDLMFFLTENQDNPRHVGAVLMFAIGEALPLVRRGSVDYLLPSNVLISNVRGPSESLYVGGARLEALCPVSTLISGMGLNITFVSYAGQVLIGFTANAFALPEAARLARYTRDAFAALERHTRRVANPGDGHEGDSLARTRTAHRGRGHARNLAQEIRRLGGGSQRTV